MVFFMESIALRVTDRPTDQRTDLLVCEERYGSRRQALQTWQNGDDGVLDTKVAACQVPGSMSPQAVTLVQTSPHAPSGSPRLANVIRASNPACPRLQRSFTEIRLANAERASDGCPSASSPTRYTGVDSRCDMELQQRPPPSLVLPQNELSRHRAHYGSFEELSWLRECFSAEEWASLRSLWPTPTQGVGWYRDGKQSWADTTTCAPATAAKAGPVPLTVPWSSSMTLTAIHHISAARKWAVIIGPEAPDNEPRSRLLLSVPQIALNAASTVTLEELLTGAIPMRYRPGGRLVPLESHKKLAG
ncbi:uncharacterized protein LOC142577876 [Dermacentor variabilis]|uniref:uncharacterized protein LOC142577876 n=1 Tax=Dermacentor variabilis TaxID=34621 RepID=UPI003F5C21F4